MLKEMRALSVIQPWAHCIIYEGKIVENRSWPTLWRGTIAIHASAKWDKSKIEIAYKDYGIKLEENDMDFGAIIGFAEIVDVITENSLSSKTRKWFVGEYGFVLSNIIALKNPIEVKGALGFWKLKGKPLKLCLDQLSSTQIKKFKQFKKL